jgi:hypothetical protein
MSFAQILNDPSVQKLLPLVVAAIAGCAGNQLPAIQFGGKVLRLVKLIVEVALVTVVWRRLMSFSEIMGRGGWCCVCPPLSARLLCRDCAQGLSIC